MSFEGSKQESFRPDFDIRISKFNESIDKSVLLVSYGDITFEVPVDLHLNAKPLDIQITGNTSDKAPDEITRLQRQALAAAQTFVHNRKLDEFA